MKISYVDPKTKKRRVLKVPKAEFYILSLETLADVVHVERKDGKGMMVVEFGQVNFDEPTAVWCTMPPRKRSRASNEKWLKAHTVPAKKKAKK